MLVPVLSVLMPSRTSRETIALKLHFPSHKKIVLGSRLQTFLHISNRNGVCYFQIYNLKPAASRSQSCVFEEE